MNPFDLAQTLGYGKNDILKFLAKANPQIKDALTNAVQMGYTSDQVYQFLGKAMSGGKVDKKMSRRVFGQPSASTMMRREENVPQEEQSTPQMGILGGLGGAAIGGAVGGPVGAVVGGMAGYNQLGKLSKAYEGHVQSGGSIPFGGFVSALAKGAALAGITAAQVGPLRKAASDYLSSAGGEGEEAGQAQPEGAQVEGAAPVEEVQAQEEVVEQQPEVGPESYDVFKKRGLETIIDSFAEQITPDEGKRALKKLYGAGWLKDIERENKKPIEKMLGEAFDYSKMRKGAEEEEKGAAQVRAPEVVEEERVKEEVVEPSAKKPSKERTFSKGEAGAFDGIFSGAVPREKKDGKIERGVRPIEGSQKSSKLQGLFYDKDTKEMRSVFGDGSVYTYDEVGFEDFQNVAGGKAKPLTEGENKYGFWHREKDGPSVGAAHSKFVEKHADKFPYRRLDASEHTTTEKQIINAKRTFDVSDFFEPFKTQRTRGRRMEKGKALKGMESALKGMDDEFNGDIVEYIEEKLKSILKHPPKMKRLQKEFKKEFL